MSARIQAELVDVGEGLFEVIPPAPTVSGAELRALFDRRRSSRAPEDRSGVWRYRELVAPTLPVSAIVARGEGNTGLYRSGALRDWVGSRGSYWIKHEGENPSCSFKDRGMCVGVSEALHRGAKVLACASTGNTSSSLASYAALAGVPCVVFVPEGKITAGKMAQTLAYGATILEVRGSFDHAMNAVEEASRAFGLGLLNSINPWRIEGQKSIGLELLDDLGWEVPDWIVLPSGNLGNISALGKALREAQAAGLIDRLPKIAGVQAAGAAPFAKFFAARTADAAASFEAEGSPETLATAIRIGNPRSWRKAIREVETLGGAVLALTDAEILDAKAAVDRAGIGCEPASAAAVAGVRHLIGRGVIPADAAVVSILTGHLLKDPETTVAYHEGRIEGLEPPANARVVVDPDAASIREALARVLEDV